MQSQIQKMLNANKDEIIDDLLNQKKFNITREDIFRYFQWMPTFTVFKRSIGNNFKSNDVEKVEKLAEKMNQTNINNPKEALSTIDYCQIEYEKRKNESSTVDDSTFDYFLFNVHHYMIQKIESYRSLTDSFQILLIIEENTNDQLNELQKEYIDEIWNSLLNKNLNTNNLLLDKINEINNVEKFKEISFKLKENIEKLCKLECFPSSSERFLNIKRTIKDNFAYKEKESFGFIVLFRFSRFSARIKKILKPSETQSKKYNLVKVFKPDVHDDLNEQAYKNKLMEQLSPGEYAKLSKVNKMIAIKILPNFLPHGQDNNHNLDDESLVRSIMIAYILRVGDRHGQNISSDLRNIDFSEEKALSAFYDGDMATILENLSNDEDLKKFQEELKIYVDKSKYPDRLKSQLQEMTFDSFKKSFNEFAKKIKHNIEKNPENIQNILTKYKEISVGKHLLFSANDFKFLNSEYMKNNINQHRN